MHAKTYVHMQYDHEQQLSIAPVHADVCVRIAGVELFTADSKYCSCGLKRVQLLGAPQDS